MPAGDLLARLRTRPFEPFRIVTTDGTTYDIRHPDLVRLAVGSATIGFPKSYPPDPALAELPTRYDVVALRHIIRLEQLAPVAGS